MKTLLIKNGGCSVVKPSGLNKVFAESQRNYALLKEKDAEIQRLNLIAKQRLGYIGEVQAQLIAFEKRDAKLADEVEVIEGYMIPTKVELRRIDKHMELTKDAYLMLRKKAKKVVGLLRGEKT